MTKLIVPVNADDFSLQAVDYMFNRWAPCCSARQLQACAPSTAATALPLLCQHCNCGTAWAVPWCTATMHFPAVTSCAAGPCSVWNLFEQPDAFSQASHWQTMHWV